MIVCERERERRGGVKRGARQHEHLHAVEPQLLGCVCVRERVLVCMCVCVCERERVCVCGRESERVRESARARARERERDRERQSARERARARQRHREGLVGAGLRSRGLVRVEGFEGGTRSRRRWTGRRPALGSRI